MYKYNNGMMDKTVEQTWLYNKIIKVRDVHYITPGHNVTIIQSMFPILSKFVLNISTLFDSCVHFWISVSQRLFELTNCPHSELFHSSAAAANTQRTMMTILIRRCNTGPEMRLCRWTEITPIIYYILLKNEF